MAVLAQRLKFYRADMSQSVLARRSDVSRKQINDLESGRNHDCKVSTVVKLGAALGVNPKRLLGWEDIEPNLIEFAAANAREFMHQFQLLAAQRAGAVANCHDRVQNGRKGLTLP